MELDLTEAPPEVVAADPLAVLRGRRRPSLRSVVEGLHDAAADPHVVGLVAKVGAGMPLARAQELRAAVVAFARVKPAVAYAETFGEGDPGTVAYYLATGFGEIWLQPSGDLGLTGIAAETTFLRGVLDKLGLEPQLAQRHEYKNAVDRIARYDYTDAFREASTRLVASAYEQVVAGIAAARRLAESRVRELVDAAPLSADRAREAGLVDHVGYRDEVYAALDRGDADLLYLSRYARTAARGRSPAGCASGTRSRSSPSPARSSRAAAGEPAQPGRRRRARTRSRPRCAGGRARTSRPLCCASTAPAVRTCLRRDLAGGRPAAGARHAGDRLDGRLAPPAVLVAMAADAIVAQPGTLTGSIGVFSGRWWRPGCWSGSASAPAG